MEDRVGWLIATYRGKLTLHDVLRAQDVSRWHMLGPRYHQSVAEHSFNVAMIAVEICRTVLTEDKSIAMDVLVKGLMHDVLETVTGDIAPPFKSRARKAVDAVEEQLAPRREEPNIVAMIVKLADLWEAKYFLRQRIKPGEEYAKLVLDRINASLSTVIDKIWSVLGEREKQKLIILETKLWNPRYTLICPMTGELMQ